MHFVQCRNKTNVASTHCETSHALFLASHLTEDTYDKNTWFLDSGCSNHMTCYKDLFSSLNASINSLVKLGDRSRIQVSGKGVVPVLTKNNVVKNIYNVYHVPTLAGNLLSVG